jgi:hypothetical protein
MLMINALDVIAERYYIAMFQCITPSANTYPAGLSNSQ